MPPIFALEYFGLNQFIVPTLVFDETDTPLLDKFNLVGPLPYRPRRTNRPF